MAVFDRLVALKRYTTWEEVAALDRRDFEIGNSPSRNGPSVALRRSLAAIPGVDGAPEHGQ